MTVDVVTNQLIADISCDLVAQIAPHELPLFRASSDAYFKDPAKASGHHTGQDETLGFGADVAITFLTPAILVIMTEVVKHLVEEVRKSLQAESSALIAEVVKKLFKKFRSKEERKVAALTLEEIKLVRQLAYEKARDLKVTGAQAGLLADSIAGYLAIASS